MAERQISQYNAWRTSSFDAWRTPLHLVAAARDWMGGIDLDPASSAEANANVGAATFFDVADNGFLEPWHGRVFLNPPGGRCDSDGLPVVVVRPKDRELPPELRELQVPKKSLWCEVSGVCGLRAPHVHRRPVLSAARAWWFKLAQEVASGRVRSAFFVGFNMEILQTTQVDTPAGLMLPLDNFLCFPRTRVSFLDDENKPVNGMTHASVLVGVPWNPRHDARKRWDVLLSPHGRTR